MPETEEHHERLLTVGDVASHVGVNIETVRRWLRAGALRGIRLGTKAGWRIRRRDLEAYLEQRASSRTFGDF